MKYQIFFPAFKEINDLQSSSKLDFGSSTKIENRVLEYTIFNNQGEALWNYKINENNLKY